MSLLSSVRRRFKLDEYEADLWVSAVPDGNQLQEISEWIALEATPSEAARLRRTWLAENPGAAVPVKQTFVADAWQLNAGSQAIRLSRAIAWLDTDVAIEEARLWDAAGFTSGVARPWIDLGFSADEAIRCIDAEIDCGAAQSLGQLGQIVEILALLETDVPLKVLLAMADLNASVEEIRNWQFAGVRPSKMLTWTEQGFLEAQSAEWREGGVDPNAAREWNELSVAPAAAISWRSCGFAASDAAPWISSGFSSGEAKSWRNHDGLEAGAEESATWKRLSFSPDEAARWNSHGFDPESAYSWRSAGHPPEQARRRVDAGLLPPA